MILENFLSFQKDEVDFLDNSQSQFPKLILIVGPNWSGKTSIFQAIKFVLGSNERDERYKKWSDFIRNGQDHTMVHIEIQNHDDVIKLRRYVIRGQSPYFELQKSNESKFKRVQAKTVQRIVKELKVNPDNHFAFVSQGKIDSIKNLKPYELSSFLEEGIGLKGLREEILGEKNSISNLNQDFQSLTVKENSLKLNLELLTPKLKRLEEKKKILDIRKKVNDELLWANKEKIQKDIDNLIAKSYEIEDSINSLKSELANFNVLLAEKEDKITDIEKEINQLSKKFGELDYQKKELVAQIQEWQQEKIKAKQELDNMAKVISQEKTEFEKLQNKKKSIEKENQLLANELAKFNDQLNNLIKEQKDISVKITQNKEFLVQYNKLVQTKEDFLQKIKENATKKDEINLDIEEIFQSLQDIDHKLNTNNWFLENPSQDLVKQLDLQIKEISRKIFELESENERIRYDQAKNIEEFKKLQKSIQERRILLPSSIILLKEEIKKRGLEYKVKGPIIEYLKYNDTLSYAIESVLGERLLYSFVVNDWDSLSLLNRLKNKINAYCNIYITKNLTVSSYPPFSADGLIGYLVDLITILNDDIDIKKVIYSKVRNCVVVENYHAGQELYIKQNFKGKCVTLKGEQIVSYKYAYETPYLKKLKGFFSVGTQKERARNLESVIESLNEKTREKRIKLSQLDLQQKELYNKKDAFNDLLYNFNQKQRLTGKKNNLYKLIYSLEQENEDFRKEVDILEEKIENFKTQRDPEFFHWNERLKTIPIEIDELNDKINILNSESRENNVILDTLKEKIDEFQNAILLKSSEYEQKQEIFRKADKKAFRIYQDLDKVEDEIKSIETSILKSQEEKKMFQQQKLEIEKETLNYKIEFEQQNIKLKTLKQELNIKNQNLERIKSEIDPLFSSQEMQIRPIEEIKKDMEKIERDLLNYVDIDDRILIEKEEIINNLSQIKKNQKLLERDINAAIATEKKIEQTYYNKFSEVLTTLQEKINHKFELAKIKAYCSLELMGDFEELGINIKAATSKDQLKSCTALSGGQISMISICLILSLQEIKPSPLCMFDEAGMFLDDKNSEASYQMIKATLEHNPIQLLMFLPKSSNSLFLLADKLIGVARVGKREASTIFHPKIIRGE